MTQSSDVLIQIENTLRLGENLPEELCAQYFSLAEEDQIAYSRALIFAGCKELAVTSNLDTNIPEVKRIVAARLMLLRLGLHTDDPRWSSWLIRKMWDTVLETPGGKVTDLYKACFELLLAFEEAIPLYVGRFILAATYNGRYRNFPSMKTAHERGNFASLRDALDNNPNPSQTFLIIQAFPYNMLSLDHCIKILKILAESGVETEFWTWALGTALHPLDCDVGQALLEAWFDEGIALPYRNDIQKWVENNSLL